MIIWLVVLVSWDYYSQYMEIKKIVQTTNQMMLICLKDWFASCRIGTCSFSASYSWKPKDFDGKSVGSDVCPAPLSSCMMVALTKAMESWAYLIHPISIRIPSDLVLHPISIPNYSLGFSAGKLPLNINLQHVNTIWANPLFFTTRHPQNWEISGDQPPPHPFWNQGLPEVGAIQGALQVALPDCVYLPQVSHLAEGHKNLACAMVKRRCTLQKNDEDPGK